MSFDKVIVNQLETLQKAQKVSGFVTFCRVFMPELYKCVTHVSEHVLLIYPVYTYKGGGWQ